MSTLVADWTALCGSDAATIYALALPFLKKTGNTYVDSKLATPEEKEALLLVDTTQLQALLKLLTEVARMGQTALLEIR